MKGILIAAALAAAPVPGQGPGKWLVIVREVRPDGVRLARLTYQRIATGTRWELRCYDTTAAPAEARHFDGVAPREDEWVMGEVPRVGHFTLSLHGDPLWAAWIPGCPGMAEPDVIARAPGSW